MDFWEQLSDIHFRTKNTVARGYVVKNERDGQMPKARIVGVNGTEYSGVDLVSLPGIAYHSAAGNKSEVIMISPNGDSSHAIALQIGDRAKYRKLDKPGLSLSHPDEPKRYINIGDDGTIEISNDGNKKFTIKPDGSVEVEGNVKFKGSASFEGAATFEGSANFQGALGSTGQTTLANTTINGVAQVGN